MSTIEEIEVWLRRPLPEPYRSFLVESADDRPVTIDKGRLFSAPDVIERNETYESTCYCPECLVIGDADGGRAIVMSLHDGSISRVSISAMTADCFEPLAPNFGDWCEAGFPR